MFITFADHHRRTENSEKTRGEQGAGFTLGPSFARDRVKSLSVIPLYCNGNVPVGAPVVAFAAILLSPNE